MRLRSEGMQIRSPPPLPKLLFLQQNKIQGGDKGHQATCDADTKGTTSRVFRLACMSRIQIVGNMPTAPKKNLGRELPSDSEASDLSLLVCQSCVGHGSSIGSFPTAKKRDYGLIFPERCGWLILHLEPKLLVGSGRFRTFGGSKPLALWGVPDMVAAQMLP